MNGKTQYNSKHRNAIIAYLQTLGSDHFTVMDLCDYFRRQNNPIGMTTVYRQLDRLVDEGMVKKYTLDGNTSACYQYVGDSCAKEQEQCFHCKCERCGVLIHLHCKDLETIQDHLKEHHHFYINPTRTVFYGLCEKCAKEGKLQ